MPFSGNMETSETIQKHLHCSICLEIYKTPKTLPCLHTFCEICLHDYICKTNSPGSRKLCHFDCPLCRAKTFPVNTETGCNQWATEFVTNHFIVSLIDEGRKDTNKVPEECNQIDGTDCVPCLMDHKMSKASCFCITCSEHLCTICQNDHKKFKVTRNHNVISKQDYPKDIAILKEMSTMGHCRAHPEENNQFKCLYHKAFICSLCATTSHKRCENVVHINEIPIERRKVAKECLSNLNSMKESLDKLLALKQNDAEDLESVTLTTESCLSALTERMQSVVAYLETDLIADCKGKMDSERNKIARSIANYTEYIDILTNYHDMAESISEYWSNTQKAVFLELLTETENKIRNELRKQECFSPWDVANMASFKLLTLKTMLKDWEKDFCVITKESSDKISRTENLIPLNCPANTKETCEKDQEESVKPGATFTKAEKVNHSTTTGAAVVEDTQKTGELNAVEKEVPLSFTFGFKRYAEYKIALPGVSCKVSSHIGILKLANDNLIILDKNNKMVKLVTPSLRICNHKTLEDEPVDICHIKYDKIGVATAQKIIVFKFTGNALWNCYNFRVKDRHILLSLCSSESNLAFLFRGKTNNAQTCIQVKSKENEIIENLTQFSDTSGKTVTFHNPTFIRSKCPEEVIVCEQRQLTMVDRQGKITRRFKNDDLKSINYITVDSKLGIFLCDTDAGIIHLLSLDLYSAGRVLITDIEKPASIVFDNGLRRLYIGCLNNDMVYVYQLT